MMRMMMSPSRPYVDPPTIASVPTMSVRDAWEAAPPGSLGRMSFCVPDTAAIPMRARDYTSLPRLVVHRYRISTPSIYPPTSFLMVELGKIGQLDDCIPILPRGYWQVLPRVPNAIHREMLPVDGTNLAMLRVRHRGIQFGLRGMEYMLLMDDCKRLMWGH